MTRGAPFSRNWMNDNYSIMANCHITPEIVTNWHGTTPPLG